MRDVKPIHARLIHEAIVEAGFPSVKAAAIALKLTRLLQDETPFPIVHEDEDGAVYIRGMSRNTLNVQAEYQKPPRSKSKKSALSVFEHESYPSFTHKKRRR